MILELSGHMFAPLSLLDEDGLVLVAALCYVVWYWISLGWGVCYLAEWCQSHSAADSDSTSSTQSMTSKANVLGHVRVGIMSLALTAMIVLQTGSWGLFWRSGRFANLESLLFLAINPPLTFMDRLVTSERWGVFGLLASIPVLLAITAAYFLRVRQVDRRLTAESHRHRRVIWIGMTTICLLPFCAICNDRSTHRLGSRVAAIKNRVSPSLTVMMSGIEMLSTEPIAACLDVKTLKGLHDHPWSPPAGDDRNRPNVVLIAVESLRHDVVHLRHQGREVLPHINQLAKSGVNFTRAYSQSTHSDYADVCLVSSLYPLRTRRHHYYRTSDPWPKTLAYDIFKQAGYATAFVSATNEGWGCMDQFHESPNLDLFYDAKRSGQATFDRKRDPGFAHELEIGSLTAGLLPDTHVMDTAIQWSREQIGERRPFFLNINFQSSHFPYELPEGAEHPFQPCELDSDVTFMNHPKSKTDRVRNAYFNGLHHCDKLVGRMVEHLRETGQLENTILWVLGENGEAFHECGQVGHAQSPVEPTIHVATVLHAPRHLTPRNEDYPLEHVDLIPTMLGLMGWPAHPNFQGIDALSSLRPSLDRRFLYFHVNSPASLADAVQWAGRWKLTIDHQQGHTRLIDIQEDPAESHDLSAQFPELARTLQRALVHWREQQLAYYHYPMYYRSYFPPSPPTVRWTGPVVRTNVGNRIGNQTVVDSNAVRSGL